VSPFFRTNRPTKNRIAGTDVRRWLNVELPQVQNTRVDLLSESAGGELIHIELQSVLTEEARQMPIFNDLLDHEVLGPAIKRGIQEGIQQGELSVLRRQLEKRFGPLPDWAQQRLLSLSTSELDDLSIRVLEARTIRELLGQDN
jgi:hypothetical protein